MKEFCDQRVSLFSNSQFKQYAATVDNREIFVEHGDRLLYKGFIIEKVGWKVSELAEGIIRTCKLDPPKIVNKKNIKKLVKWREKNLPTDSLYIIGHLHFLYHYTNLNIISSGFARFGHIQYVELIDGKVNLVKVKYND